jgi:hypothetical protein
VARDLFMDGHSWEAVLAASKELINYHLTAEASRIQGPRSKAQKGSMKTGERLLI